ncbi:CAP domain-containing protein [Kitasatospora mediocidica]|uniref:CAP domain-containing protein n=1 Tax=Kitasatospora mediocidica TaxID=58352 RepID=UPI000690FEF1
MTRPVRQPRRRPRPAGALALSLCCAALVSAVVTVGPAAAAPADNSARVIALVNQHRRQAGCGPLTADRRLDSLAQSLSDDMAGRGFFDHTDPDGHSPWDRARAASIGYLGGENIARGQPTPEAVVTAWMDSPGHRANLLDCRFTTLGTGLHQGPGGPWWTEDFGYPQNAR